jgi:hypothetical protein
MTARPRPFVPEDVLTDEQGRPYFVGSAYGPEDAAAHRRVMARLATMTQAEFLQSLVRSGICDAAGQLLPPYADEDDGAPARPPGAPPR